MEENRCARFLARSADGLLVADDVNLYILSTMRADYVEGNRPIHHTFGDGSNHRVDTIQALVQHAKPLLEALHFRCLLLGSYQGSFFLGQDHVLQKSGLPNYIGRRIPMSKLWCEENFPYLQVGWFVGQ